MMPPKRVGPGSHPSAIQGVANTTIGRGGDVQMTTSKGDASKAGRLLSNPKTPKPVKSVAASDLAQAKGGKTKKK
jgi:hypothetical protein